MSQPALLLFVCLGPAEQDHGLNALEAAIAEATTEDRSLAIARLDTAIARRLQQPDVARGQLPAELLEAYVILARLYIAEGDESTAREVIDELIRSAPGQVPPVRSYGPAVSTLYRERKQILSEAGRALLEVDCEVECEVVVNGRRLSDPKEILLLGEYQLWVRAEGEGNEGWVPRKIELREARGHQILRFEDPNPSPDPPPSPRPPEAPAPSKRMLPRGIELVGAALGLGLMITGAVLLSFDGRCSEVPVEAGPGISPEVCGEVYKSQAGGGALLGVGGGVLLVSGVLLGIDEYRVGDVLARRVTISAGFKF